MMLACWAVERLVASATGVGHVWAAQGSADPLSNVATIKLQCIISIPPYSKLVVDVTADHLASSPSSSKASAMSVF
jgi:hypothetical protein